MITINKITISIAIILAVLFIACQKEVEVKLPESKYKLVLNSILSEDSLISVSISRSKKLYIDDNVNTEITTASVLLYENDKLIETLPYRTNGNYKSTFFKPKVGYEYKIVVKETGYDDAIAKETLLKKAEIFNINYQDSSLVIDQQIMSKISFEINDKAEEKNYYEVSVLSAIYTYEYDNNTGEIIDSTRVYNATYLTVTDDLLKENISTPGIDIGSNFSTDALIFSDAFFDGKKYRINVFLSTYESTNDSLIIRVKSMTKSYYEYVRTKNLQINVGSDPFSEPVRVYTNVEGGLGILGSYTETKKVIMK